MGGAAARVNEGTVATSTIDDTTARPDHDDTDDVEADDVGEPAGRAGLATRGVMYLVSAFLTIRIAMSGSSSSTDDGPGKQGALRSVAEQPLGRVLVIVLAVGLAGYAIWRLIAAFTYEPDDDDSQLKALAKRVSYVGRALIYGAALATAVSLIVTGTDSGGSGGGSGGQEQTARIFDLPLGRWIVLGVGVGFLIAAGYNLYRAVTQKFQRKWNDELSPWQRRIAVVVSVAGLVGHMGVFAVIGFFLTRAAIEFDPNEPVGLDQSVRRIAEAPWGTWVLGLLAAGMVAYALFSFIEARWRDLLDQ